ncbi:MAG: HK97 gp10 family phage protein [Deltaproteobacteria bacterium]|nr:HK97 gp10 family phage protein [Deltaproteobacteria bacterium]
MSNASVAITNVRGGRSASPAVIVRGDKEMERILRELPDRLSYNALKSAMKKVAKPLITAMKSRAPKSSKQTFLTAHRHYSKGAFMTKLKRHRPGELRRSIGIVMGKKKAGRAPYMWIGPRFGRKATGDNDGWYFHFLEYGTMRQPPQPFIRPAYDSTKRQIETGMDREVKKLIDDYVMKHGPKYF